MAEHSPPPSSPGGPSLDDLRAASGPALADLIDELVRRYPRLPEVYEASRQSSPSSPQLPASLNPIQRVILTFAAIIVAVLCLAAIKLATGALTSPEFGAWLLVILVGFVIASAALGSVVLRLLALFKSRP